MPSPSRRPLVVPVLLLAVLVAACSGDAATASPPASVVAEASSAPTPTPPAFPQSLTDDEGTEIEIPSAPQRIVSLTPANTEILFELGVGDRVVATDSGSDYPAEAGPLPDVADFASVNVEAVVDLEADLVLAGGLGFTPPDVVTQLRALDIPVIVIYAASVEGVYEDIELIGASVGASAEATELVTATRAEMDAVSAAAIGAGTPPRTFYEIGYTDATGQIFAPAEASFVAEMVTLAGGDVITTGDPADYEIALETLIEADPEVIVLGVNPFYAPTPEAVAARTGWNVMTAVVDDAIRTVQDIEVTRPGPRLPIGLRNLALAIHPDVTLPAAP